MKIKDSNLQQNEAMQYEPLLCGVCDSELEFIGSPENDMNEWKFINNKFVPDDLYKCKKCGKLLYLSELNAT